MKESGTKIGSFLKENYSGGFIEGWKNALKACEFEMIDISAAFAYLVSPKEDVELSIVKKSCMVTVDVFTKYLKDQIMEIIDSEKVGYFLLPQFDENPLFLN